MVVLDATIVNIALPSAQRDLGFSTESRQWVVTAYALAFGSLLLVGGKIGDLFGRKWTLITGLLGFAAVSFIGGLAPSFGVLVVARALQGVFGALLAPSALSLLTVTFAGSPDRPKAFGIFAAVATAGASVGLLLGGALTEALTWRWCMYVNLFIAVPAAFAAFRLIANDPHPQRPKIDWRGAALACTGLFAIVFGFSEAERDSFLGADHDRRAHPRSAAHRGVRREPAPGRVPAAAAAHRVGPSAWRRLPVDRDRRLEHVRRVPVPHVLHADQPGLLATANGLRVPADDRRDLRGRADDPDARAAARRRASDRDDGDDARAALDGAVLHAPHPGVDLPHRRAARAADARVGMPCVFAPSFASATLGVDRQDAGVASAMVNTSQQVGGAIGTAILSTIYTHAASSYLSTHDQTATVAGDAAIHGYTAAFTFAAVLFGIGLVLAAIVLPRTLSPNIAPTSEPLPEPA